MRILSKWWASFRRGSGKEKYMVLWAPKPRPTSWSNTGPLQTYHQAEILVKELREKKKNTIYMIVKKIDE